MFFYSNQNLGDEIYMRIEAADLSTKTVLADFIESNNFAYFNGIAGFDFPVAGPSMILFINYQYKKREGIIYSLRRTTVERFVRENRIRIVEDSLIISLEIDLNGI